MAINNVESDSEMGDGFEDNVTELRIPEDRVAVLIGRNGETKKLLEEKGHIALDIESENGIISVRQNGDPLKANISLGVIQAIGRGFNPQKAMELLQDNFQLIVIPLRDFAKPGSKRIAELRGRLIGTGGKTRRVVEELTSTYISVYGDTVSIIGDYVSVEYAREALMLLIKGSKQRTVYTFLEKNARELRLKRIEESFG